MKAFDVVVEECVDSFESTIKSLIIGCAIFAVSSTALAIFLLYLLFFGGR